MAQNSRYHALINEVYEHHWPETHPFQPKSKEHLRHWLLVKVGWVRSKRIRLPGWDGHTVDRAMVFTELIANWLRETDGPAEYMEWRFDEATGVIEVTIPRSTRFDRMTPAQASAVFSDTDLLLQKEIGIENTDEILAHREQRRDE